MTNTQILIIIAAWIVIAILGYEVFRRWSQGQRTRERLFVERGGEGKAPPLRDREPRGLTRWLFLAGYRMPGAAVLFLLITLAMIGVGLLLSFLIRAAGVPGDQIAALRRADTPDEILKLASTLLGLVPIILIVVLALIPTLIVRAARRRIVSEVETDLPITLELLATLAESGLSFDAALDRVLKSQREDRALQRELRTFQAEILAGRGRIESLRRLARRLDVPSFSSFISAVVQAENTGSGIAAVLRRQANDLRSRRRERALEFAMSLPVKRLMPMILCFLPGIMVAALGPSIFALFSYVDSYIQQGTLPQ